MELSILVNGTTKTDQVLYAMTDAELTGYSYVRTVRIFTPSVASRDSRGDERTK